MNHKMIGYHYLKMAAAWKAEYSHKSWYLSSHSCVVFPRRGHGDCSKEMEEHWPVKNLLVETG